MARSDSPTHKLCSLVLGIWLTACGPTPATTSESQSTGTEQTTETSVETETTAGPESCTPVPGDDPLAGDPSQCSMYEHSSQPASEAVVTLANHLEQPILVMDRVTGCHHVARRFTLNGVSGERTVQAPTTNCQFDWPACEIFLGVDHSCLLCETLTAPILIAPGGFYDQVWPGRVLAATTFPEGCGSSAGESCEVLVPLGPGSYTLESVGALAADCGIDASMCEGGGLDPSGSCTIIFPEPEWSCEANLTATQTYDGVCTPTVVFE